MTDAAFNLDALSEAELANLYKQADAQTGEHPALAGMSDAQLQQLYEQSKAGAPGMEGVIPAFNRFATFNLSDPAGAAAGAGYQKLVEGNEKPFGELYQTGLTQRRGEANNFAAEHPWANGIAALMGAGASLGYPLSPAISSVTGRMGAGASIGAGIGGVSGAANSRDNLLRDAAIGAGVGGLAGAAAPVVGELASVPINAISRRFLGGADSQALDRIGNRITQDTRAGGPTVDDIQQALAAANGKPLTLADVAGENTSALAGRMTRSPGEGREASTRFLADRSGGTAPRMLGDVDTALPNPSGNAFATAQDLMRSRATAAAPLWKDFYAAPALNPDHIAAGGQLDQLMTRPAMVDASRRALRIAAEEGRDPASLGITFNVAGDPVFERVPSWQTLDYVKRGLDDVINGLPKNPITGRLQPDESGRAVLGTKKTYLDFLDQNNPAYAPARDAYAGPSAALSALQKGQDFRSMRPELIDYTLGNMNPSEREFFRIGAGDALRHEISRTGDPRVVIGSNAVNQRGGDLMKQQLRPLFDNEDAYNKFVNDVSNEALMVGNTNRWIGNSATAGRLAEDAGGHGPGGPLVQGATMAGAMLAGEPALALSRVPGFFRSLRNAGELAADNPQVNAATTQRLFSADQGQNADTLAQIIARAGRPGLSQRAVPPLASALAGVYPQIALPAQNNLAAFLARNMPGAGPSERP